MKLACVLAIVAFLTVSPRVASAQGGSVTSAPTQPGNGQQNEQSDKGQKKTEEQKTADTTRNWSIDTAAGGGFAGIKSAAVQTVPHTTCDTNTPPICKPDLANVTIVKNSTYSWQPALAVGLVFRYIPKINPEESDAIGFGVGGQFVFVPHGDSTKAAPAVSFHVGTQSKQVFFGAIFAPADTVEIPGGGSRAVVPTGFDTNSLVRTNGGYGPTWFAGVVIAGMSVTSQPSPSGSGDHKDK